VCARTPIEIKDAGLYEGIARGKFHDALARGTASEIFAAIFRETTGMRDADVAMYACGQRDCTRLSGHSHASLPLYERSRQTNITETKSRTKFHLAETIRMLQMRYVTHDAALARFS